MAITYAPSAGELVLNAYSRLSIRATALLAEHMFTARQEFNLMLAEWGNKGPNLWVVDLVTIPLVAGQATYPLDTTTIAVLDVYVRDLGNPADLGDFGPDFGPDFATIAALPGSDRILLPISRTEYATYPEKTTPGQPTVYWYDRLITSALTVYPVPAVGFVGTLNVYRWNQVDAAALENGGALAIPYRFLDAATAGLSHRVARHYAPQLEGIRKADAMEAWLAASTQDVEKTDMYITPLFSRYFRS